jgi:hypothetical protein
MDAQELHDACYDAMCQCPQFRGWDDDGEFPGYGQFGKIPSKGLYKTIQFWREWGDLLWERGYEKALPQEAQDLFDNIERVIEQAIKDYCKGPRKTTPPTEQRQWVGLTAKQIASIPLNEYTLQTAERLLKENNT